MQVSIKAWNQFNNLSVLDNYTIEIPITNPAVECLTEETPSERPIPYQASVSNGSGITISWNFGDGNPHVRADPPNTLIPSSGLVDKFTHTFTYGNFFNISVSNSATSTYLISSDFDLINILTALQEAPRWCLLVE